MNARRPTVILYAKEAKKRQATNTGGAKPQLMAILPQAEKGKAREHGGTAPGKPKNTGGNPATSDKGRARLHKQTGFMVLFTKHPQDEAARPDSTRQDAPSRGGITAPSKFRPLRRTPTA